MDSSSKGLRLCLTPAVMIAVFVGFTRGRICVPRFSFIVCLLAVARRCGNNIERK